MDCWPLCLLVPGGAQCACPDRTNFLPDSKTTCDTRENRIRGLNTMHCFNVQSLCSHCMSDILTTTFVAFFFQHMRKNVRILMRVHVWTEVSVWSQLVTRMSASVQKVKTTFVAMLNTIREYAAQHLVRNALKLHITGWYEATAFKVGTWSPLALLDKSFLLWRFQVSLAIGVSTEHHMQPNSLSWQL